MGRSKVTSIGAVGAKASRRQAPRSSPLTAGLHAAQLEMSAKGSYRARLLSGERVCASLAPGVSPALAAECLRDRRTVLLAPGPDGALVVGALQTEPTRSPVEASEVEIAGERSVVLRAGKATLVLEADGTVRIGGQTMTAHIARVVRFAAASVELP
ncbi:MAG: hypothetical protein WKG00_23345 [Polyangiaceae bacterium]